MLLHAQGKLAYEGGRFESDILLDLQIFFVQGVVCMEERSNACVPTYKPAYLQASS